MKIVNIFAIRRNNTEYSQLQVLAVNAEHAVVDTVQWRVPVGQDGVLVGFEYQADGPKPSDDSLKVLRLKDTLNNEFYYAAIPDTASADAWRDAVNSCCDTPVDMPAVTLPDIFVEEAGCADADANYNYFTYTVALGAGQVYVASGSKNGTALAATPKDGFASLGALKTWADSNWNGQYTMTVSGTKVTLTSADATTGSITVEIRNYFESAADAALTSGNHYTLDGVVNGVALPKITGEADGALTTIADAANANPYWAQWGKYSVVATKVRLVAYNNVDSATLTLTEVAP